MIKRFRLKYLRDFDDSCPTTFESDQSLRVGDVIFVDNGFWHAIHEIVVLKSGLQLVLAESAQSPKDAKLLRQQMLEEE